MRHLVHCSLALFVLGCSDDGTGGGGGVGAQGGSGAGASGGAGGVNFSECDTVGSCVLAQPGCCPLCTIPTLDDVEPIRSDLVDEFKAATCNGVEACACDGPNNPNLFATCEEGECVEGDLESSPFSTCIDASDCVLLPGLACCACDVPADQWVAVSSENGGALLGMLCGDVDCQPCEVPPPANLLADCVQGHCTVSVGDP